MKCATYKFVCASCGQSVHLRTTDRMPKGAKKRKARMLCLHCRPAFEADKDNLAMEVS